MNPSPLLGGEVSLSQVIHVISVVSCCLRTWKTLEGILYLPSLARTTGHTGMFLGYMGGLDWAM